MPMLSLNTIKTPAQARIDAEASAERDAERAAALAALGTQEDYVAAGLAAFPEDSPEQAALREELLINMYNGLLARIS